MAKCIKCQTELPQDAAYCPACGKKQIAEQRKALKRPNGAGTVYKLTGRRVKPWVAARNKVIIGYYAKKSEALEALGKLSGRDITERYNMTFAQVYEQWSAEHFRDIGPSGQTSYKNAYDIFTALHSRKFRDLKTADFQAVVDCHKDSKSLSSLSKYKQLLTQMSKWALREEIISQNLAAFVKLPKATKTEKPVLSPDDIQKLVNDDSETAKIMLMLVYTGMRIGELFKLSVSDYHGDYVIGGSKTEAGEDRVIPIRPEGRKYFEYFACQATGEQLLSGYTGNRTAKNFAKRELKNLLAKLGINNPDGSDGQTGKTSHAARRTYASWAVQEHVQPEILQKVLGHARYDTTIKYYVHTDAEQLVDAITDAGS